MTSFLNCARVREAGDVEAQVAVGCEHGQRLVVYVRRHAAVGQLLNECVAERCGLARQAQEHEVPA